MMWPFRLLLLLYPRRFRRRYRRELLETYQSMRADAPITRRARAPFWRSVIGDALRAAARLREGQVRQALTGRPGRDLPGPAPPPRRSDMDTVVQDVRHALRSFGRRPGFAAVAILSLALAIGGNTAIYGILDGFVFNPFSYPQPDRFVAVGVTFPKLSSETTYIEALSPPEYLDLRGSRSFAAIGAFDLGNRNLSGGDVPERVFTALVLDDLFPVVGMPPALGRGFTPDELLPNGPPVAIISHRLWQGRFAGDQGILERAVRIGGRSVSIVGVMPPGLVLVGTDLWIPWGGNPAVQPRNRRQFNVVARLAPGVTLEDANREMEEVARRVDREERERFAEYEGWRLTATPWAAAVFQDVRPAAFMLLAAAALVLLIACANLVNLFLARSTTRHRELAVRLALGAGRWRIARLLLTESLLLAAAGAVAGLVLAWAAFAGAPALVPPQLQMLGLEVRFTPRVLAWSLALAVASGVLVALVPAFNATRTDPHDSLKADARVAGRRGNRLRHGLVVGQIAVSVVLLLGAGLLMRTLLNIQRADPGYDPDDVLTFRLTLPDGKYEGAAANAFFERLVERIEQVPGVHSAAAASQFPPMGALSTTFAIEPGSAARGATLPTALITVATPRLFETLSVPLRRGRGFDASDRAEASPAAIVNQALVNRYFPEGEPLGARLTLGPEGRTRTATIVGIVADVRNSGAARPPRPEIFVPLEQAVGYNQVFVLARTEAAPAVVLPELRRAVASLDPEQPIYAIQTLRDAIALSAFQQRVSAVLLGIFAVVALTLAAIGLHGVMAFVVSARTQEMGVRIALGAGRGAILWLVFRQVLATVAAGLAIGIALLAGAAGVLDSLLFGVRAVDPLTIAAVSTLLAGIAILAAWVPASRAAGVDPIEALRYE